MNGNTSKRNRSDHDEFVYHFSQMKNNLPLMSEFHLTLLHPERPKLYTILAFLSAVGLKKLLLLVELATRGANYFHFGRALKTWK